MGTHLARLAKDNYGRLVTQHVNPTNGRRTYSPKSAPPDADDTADVSAEVVDLATRRRGGKSSQKATPKSPETLPPTD